MHDLYKVIYLTNSFFYFIKEYFQLNTFYDYNDFSITLKLRQFFFFCFLIDEI